MELSDVSESENNDAAAEVACPCKSHDGKEILNVVFPISVDTYLAYAFMESDFFKQFHANRKTTDLTFHPWEVDPTNGLKVRKISCLLAATNMSIGPKVIPSTQTQTMQKCCQPGQLYVIKVDAVSAGIPYADDFYTHHIHCITRVSDNECRLRVHSSVKYKKSVWGFIKLLIEKKAVAAIEEYFNDWETCMHKESSEPSKESIDAIKAPHNAPGSVQSNATLDVSSDFLNRAREITVIWICTIASIFIMAICGLLLLNILLTQ